MLCSGMQYLACCLWRGSSHFTSGLITRHTFDDPLHVVGIQVIMCTSVSKSAFNSHTIGMLVLDVEETHLASGART